MTVSVSGQCNASCHSPQLETYLTIGCKFPINTRLCEISQDQGSSGWHRWLAVRCVLVPGEGGPGAGERDWDVPGQGWPSPHQPGPNHDFTEVTPVTAGGGPAWSRAHHQHAIQNSQAGIKRDTRVTL